MHSTFFSSLLLFMLVIVLFSYSTPQKPSRMRSGPHRFPFARCD